MKALKTLIVLALLGAGIYFLLQNHNAQVVAPAPIDVVEQPSVLPDRVPSKYVCVGEFCDGSGDSDDASSRTVLQIPLIKQGGNVGCGVGIFFAPHAVPKTTGVLDATYKLLFDLKPNPEVAADGFHNTVGAYTGLHYKSVSIKDGTAKLMLTGTMYGPGHCAEPELRAQIDQAAFQFDTVKKIEVYLNGKLFDWCTTSDADPTESKCDTTPRYWIDTK